MKNLTQLAADLNEMTSILNGVEKLHERYKLLQAVQSVNEILIEETRLKKSQAKEQYSNELLKSFINLHDTMIRNYEARYKRATDERSQLFHCFDLMEIQVQYGTFYKSRDEWNESNEMSLEDFSDKYAVLY